ncbi:E3 ubiquitin-protein ligase WAV3-like [Rutidosis leptorrhynchoides]|uniref:E3 ubiquitin-protein ligase WAV3-like n=1 Tax=Rutidosis leptorrhynchoides TaxID=125765 RepID=UPI003A9A21FD
MGSTWRKLKMALSSNLCIYVPTADSDASPLQSERCSDAALLSPATEHWSFSGSTTAQRPWSPALRLSKSLSRSSKKCTICLASMRRGEGQAIFTAECSHSFHFQCIASNVKHGNQICPICRANWKQVPLQTSSGLDSPSARTQDNPVMTVIRPFPSRLNSTRRIAAHNFPANEPNMFNDDELLDLEPSKKNISNASDESSLKRVVLETYTEVPAVPRFTTVNDFTVLLHLKAPVCTSARAPVDLVTVLDISGSMAGTKLALLKRAMGFVIQNLGPSDRLSVVVFSSNARRLFPLTRMSDAGKQHALQAVNALAANGGTNIAEGLRKGGKVMEDRRGKNAVASIILLSDGQDTYTVNGGVGSNVAGGQTQSNHKLLVPPGVKIPVHAFGFGADHDAESMHTIAEVSGGTFSFIETESVIQDAFAQCIGGLLSVVVKGLQVIIESVNVNVRLQSLKAGSYKNQLMPDRKSGCIDVGDLYADEERDFLVSVNIPKETELTFGYETSLLKVNCYYNDPLTKETIKLVTENVTVKRPENVGKENVISIEVDRQRNRLQSAEAMVLARTIAEEGDLKRAISTLENFRKVLMGTVSAKSGDRLCMALDAELKEMQERMATRNMYENSGRAYILSGLSSHSWQRATARGDSTDGSSLVQAYQTPLMVEMLTRSQANLDVRTRSSQPRPR